MNINECINASDLKPNKREAFNIIKELITNSSDYSNEVELAQLYNYFMPTVGAKPKTGFQWIHKAVSKKKDVRYYLTLAYSNGTDLVGTDGHRLHVIRNSFLDEGYYNSEGEKIDHDDWKYPQFERVIPTKLYTWNGNIEECDKMTVENELAYVIHSDNHSGRAVFNKKYVDQALSGITDPIYQIDDTNTRLVISGTNPDLSNRLTLIMALKE